MEKVRVADGEKDGFTEKFVRRSLKWVGRMERMGDNKLQLDQMVRKWRGKEGEKY